MALADYIFPKLIHNLPYSPTQDQEKLFSALSAFIAAPDRDILLVNGYAGTGKSSAMLALVRTAKELDIPVVLLAPTGRSAKVLASYTYQQASTIHRKIYRRRQPRAGDMEEGSFGSFSRDVNKLENALFVVDEASLISNSSGGEGMYFGSGRLLDDLIDYVRSGVGNKLILLGDSAQLPPVGLSISPALDPQYLERYGALSCVTMRQVLRQAADSGILYNASLLRFNIEKGTAALPEFRFEPFTDICRIGSTELLEHLNTSIEHYGLDNIVVLCRSNKRAGRYNQGIRGRLLFREEQLTRGDRLMVVKNCYSFTDRTKEMDFIANGDVAELMRIKKYETRYDLHFAEAVLRFPDYNDVEIEAKVLLDTLASDSPALPEAKQRQLFSQVLTDYADLRTQKKRYEAMRRDPYLNALQIKYSTAITCHKSQGGQWKAVYVEKSFFDDTSIDSLRWYYTAFTRAEERLYLINF